VALEIPPSRPPRQPCSPTIDTPNLASTFVLSKKRPTPFVRPYFTPFTRSLLTRDVTVFIVCAMLVILTLTSALG
jgi:hypothetical protein